MVINGAQRPSERLNIAVLAGSVRSGRFCPVVTRWFIEQAEARDDVLVDRIDLGDFELPADMSGNHDSASFAERIGAADAFVVVTPEYNHSYPGPLKTAIDTVGPRWQAKPVAFVAYGGLSGGLRAVEALRLVFAEVHAATIRDTVSFHGAWDQFDGDGRPHDLNAANAAAATLVDKLVWWGRALRTARREEPYAV
jgi:NAD(P)H-dependent FMN reductase